MRLKYITKFFLVAACGLVTFAACSDEYLDKKVDVSETAREGLFGQCESCRCCQWLLRSNRLFP